MSNIITFENTLLAPGKRGMLKPMDASGYYKMNAGGFNIPNRHGVTYPINNYLLECMREGSDLDRRIKEGQVYTELGHPPQYYLLLINGQVVRKPITELFEWINRLRTIDMDNVCGHIRKIHWEFERKGDPRAPVYNEVEIIPFGPKKMFLEQSLPNPDINTALSIRTVTAPQKFGDKERQVEYFTGYDAVVDQGVMRACKHLSAGMESLLEGYTGEDPSLSVINTTVEEVLFVCQTKMANPAVAERYQGTESFARVQDLLNRLKELQPRKETKVQLVSTNSLNVFR